MEEAVHHVNPAFTMFSPATYAIRQKIFGHIIRIPSPSLEHDNEAGLLDPSTLSGLDEVAFYDLQEHEERYDVLTSAKFDYPLLMFAHNPNPVNKTHDIDTELVVKALIPNNHATQEFSYRVNALQTLLEYVRATQCAHSALIIQREALITAINIEIADLLHSAISQWSLNVAGEKNDHGLRVIHIENRRNLIYDSPLSLSIMILTAIIHCSMGVSRKSCDFIISSFKAILTHAADMQGSRARQFNQQHLRNSPNTLSTTLHLLNLPPPLQLYVTCPRCSCLYHELRHIEVPPTCTSRDLDGSVCGEPMFLKLYRGGKVRNKPIRRYSHQLFITWLSEILLRPGVEDMLESATPSPSALMTDVWNGTFWNNFPGNGEPNFFDAPKDELRLCMLLYHDFFNPLHNKTAGKLRSIGCFYMVCLNLPPHLRYDSSFVYLASIVPGPSEPSTEALQNFIRPIVDEMKELYDNGVWISQTHKYPQGRKVRVSVPLNCMDSVAARAFGGWASHGHRCFCYLCSAALDRIAGNKLSEFMLRTKDTHRFQAAQWENSTSLAARNRLFEQHGVRSCEWLRFSWWDMYGGTVIGPMHWIRNVLDKQLRRNMNWSWSLPTGIPSPPPLSRPISKLEYEWGKQALYELDGAAFMHYKLPEPLVRYMCRERGIYEAGLSSRHLMTELNQWRIQCGIISAEGHLTRVMLQNQSGIPLSVAKAHYHLSKAPRPSTLQSHASIGDLQYLCGMFGLSSAGSKLVLAERLVDHYAKIWVQDIPSTVEYSTSKSKKETVAVLGLEVLTEVQNDMGQTTLPRWLKHPPKNFATITHGKLQSEEFKSLALVSLVLTLVRLWGTEAHGPFRDRLDNFLHLMLAVRILSFQSLVESDIEAFEYHYQRYLDELSRLYPYASRTPSQHMGIHIPSFLRKLGPMTRLSESTCEMFIGMLQDIATNFKFGELELTIHREFIMAARLKGLIEQDSLASGLGQFAQIAQDYLGGEIPGRIGNGWQTNRNNSLALTSEQVALLTSWAIAHHIRLSHQIQPCSSIQQGNVFYA